MSTKHSREVYKSYSNEMNGLHLIKPVSGNFMICSINLPLNSANSKLLYVIGNNCCIVSFAGIPTPILLHRYQHCSCCDQHLLNAIFILMYYFIVKTEIIFFPQSIFQLFNCSSTFLQLSFREFFSCNQTESNFAYAHLLAIQLSLTSERSPHKMSVIGLYDNIGCEWGT